MARKQDTPTRKARKTRTSKKSSLSRQAKRIVKATPRYVYTNGLTDEEVKAMTPRQRAKIAQETVPGLVGKAQQIWIREGKNIRDQLNDVAQAVTAATQAQSRIDAPAKNRKRHRQNRVTTKQLDNKETNVQTKSTPKTKPAARKAQEQPKVLDLPVTTKEMAAAAGVSPKDLRVFLRANADRFPKADGRYAWKSTTGRDAKALIKAIAKESK